MRGGTEGRREKAREGDSGGKGEGKREKDRV